MRTITQSRYSNPSRGADRRWPFPIRLLCFVFLSTAAWFVLMAPLFIAL